jgi:hypothetical protein
LLTVFGLDGAARLTFAQESAIAAAGHATAITHTAAPTNFFGPLMEDLLSSGLSRPGATHHCEQAEGIITSTPESIENFGHQLLDNRATIRLPGWATSIDEGWLLLCFRAGPGARERIRAPATPATG